MYFGTNEEAHREKLIKSHVWGPYGVALLDDFLLNMQDSSEFKAKCQMHIQKANYAL